ncbi:Acetylglucosaminyltransferase EXT1/exostosin 1 [Handroanthus impetiginosus]|uniref:Acetylglucosaminyltransferase EXT1/exostosin 1 n=1 Tax=Handroanthus impetiginosus TaxID=429701 RepID=A0A2G9HI64_9LAMI|nr:Acetylglucosaminyltransferase EXT1/exostosin 1 [Handroanthus impetiginosus]
MSEHSSSDLHSHKKPKNFSPKNTPNKYSIRIFLCKCSQLFIILLFQVFILPFVFRTPSESTSVNRNIQENITLLQPLESKKCDHGLVYVYDLPPMFNQELLDNCRDLDPWHSRCNAISNHGLGPKAAGLSGVPENLVPAWYWTDMFAGEVIYHDRILKHKCRTTEPESATAFYIPFYAGLAVGKYLFTNYSAKERDMYCERLLKWVHDQPPWKRSNGSDHFIMLGRMTWDFRRSRDEDWGSSFINMPLMKRVLRLAVERDPWDHLEIGVPYPTGFHPKSKLERDQWLNFVENRNRTSLFTFVGGKRKVKGDFRTLLLNHCYNEMGSCRVVDCSGTKCYDGTSEILEAFLDSDFCLQPRGDAYTRRSTFDCMLAGSIPVFFWKRSIYNQYEWFLGDEPEKFSVFIDRKDVRNGTSIRKVLEGYSRDEVKKMREKIISYIPKFVYNFVNGDEVESTNDAFDVAIDGVLRRIHKEKGKKKDGIKLLASRKLT